MRQICGLTLMHISEVTQSAEHAFSDYEGAISEGAEAIFERQEAKGPMANMMQLLGINGDERAERKRDK